MSVAPEEQYSTACEEHQPLDTPGNNPHQHYGAAYPAASPALPHIQPTTTLDAAIASYTEPNSFCDWRAEEDSSFYSSNSSSCSSSGTEDYFFFGQNVSPSAPSVPATPHFSHVASGTSSTPYYQPVSHSGVPMYSAPVGSVASPDSAASLPANLYSPGNVYVRPQLWHRHAYQGPLGASLAAAAQDGLEAGGAVDPQNIAPEVYNSMTQQGLVQPDEIDPFDTIRDSSNRSSTYSSVFDSPFFGDPFQQQHIGQSVLTELEWMHGHVELSKVYTFADSSPESAPASVPLTVQRSFSQLPLDKDDTIGRSASRSAKKPSPARSSRRMQPEATTIQALDLEGLQLTSQGTIKGHRMPVRGVNPSTTGCFMDLNDDTPYHAMGTKRSRGRSPHTKAYLSMLLESPSRIGELVQIVGATKGGKPKRFFP